MEIKIAVATHKQGLTLKHPYYMPIHVGKALHPDISLNIQEDNVGDNISDENDYYCELTAIYWLWKNVKADVKGLFHYRRILTIDSPFRLKFRQMKTLLVKGFYIPQYDANRNQFLKHSEKFANKLPELISKYDIICTDSCICNPNIKAHFSIIGQEYIFLLQRSIEALYPSLYVEFLKMLKSKRLHSCNISVMGNEIFDEYCNFLFSILEDVKRRVVEEKYIIDLHEEKMFSRKLGYLAEMLTSFFITLKKSEKTKIKTLPIAFLT